MTIEEFIAKNIRSKIPDIEQAAIDAAIQHYKRRQSEKKGSMFDECLKIAKQHMVKVKK